MKRSERTIDARPSLPSLGEVLDFLRLIWAMDHALQRLSKQMERTVGVTGPQRFVIRIVGRFPGIPAGELARLLHIHPSTLSGILARLERSGLLRRRADPRDARRSLLGLTEKGRRLDVASAGTVESAMESTLRGAHPRTLQAAREVLQSFADSLAASGEADEAPAIAEPSPRARRSRRIASPREQRRARRRW